MLRDPKHPMTPGSITDDVSKCINRCILNYYCVRLLQDFFIVVIKSKL